MTRGVPGGPPDGLIGSAELRRTLGISIRQLYYLFERLPELESLVTVLPDERTRGGFRRRYPPSFVTRLDVASRLARAGRIDGRVGAFISDLPSITRVVFEHKQAPAEGQLAVYQPPTRLTYLDEPDDLVDVLDPDGGVVVFLHDLHGVPEALAMRTEPTQVPFVDYTEE